MASGKVSIDVKSIIHRAVFTKSLEWQYEKEWPIFGGSGRNAGEKYEDLKFHPCELRAVVFGLKTPEADRTALVEIAYDQFPHVELWQVKKASTDFELNIVPLQGKKRGKGSGTFS